MRAHTFIILMLYHLAMMATYSQVKFNPDQLKKIAPGGSTTFLAGAGAEDYAEGTGAGAMFNYPEGSTVDGNGNIYVADRFNNRIRLVTP
ncbi:MAG: hypothetical protein QM734_10205 [Cyclobacteriaceae bacterium]